MHVGKMLEIFQKNKIFQILYEFFSQNSKVLEICDLCMLIMLVSCAYSNSFLLLLFCCYYPFIAQKINSIIDYFFKNYFITLFYCLRAIKFKKKKMHGINSFSYYYDLKDFYLRKKRVLYLIVASYGLGGNMMQIFISTLYLM